MNVKDAPRHLAIGAWGGVELAVGAWDSITAPVDLSFACVFAHEKGNADLKGGLLHLDRKLGGALVALRRDGEFHGHLMETLLLTQLPPGTGAKALMLIGVGDPDAWTPEVMEHVTLVAFREAVRQGANSAALAPGLLDSGLSYSGASAAGAAMLDGVIRAIDTENRLVAMGLSTPFRLTRWFFDAGVEHVDAAALSFRSHLATLSSDESRTA